MKIDIKMLNIHKLHTYRIHNTYIFVIKIELCGVGFCAR